MRVLLVAATTGYQVRSFGAAAERLGVELLLATDRCHVLDDPWRDAAIPIRFDDDAGSVAAVRTGIGERPLDGVLAVGDRPAVTASLVAEALGLPGHPPAAARAAANKWLARCRFQEAGLPGPWFLTLPLADPRSWPGADIRFPCVVKPLALAASQGVMRADSFDQLEEAMTRLRQLADVSPRNGDEATGADVLVEEYVPGSEVAVEGVVRRGELQVLAVFDKPDPLEGPFFEETIYVTPSRVSARTMSGVQTTIGRAVRALGLTDGPIHGECRLNETGVYVLEVAARPIGGLCAKTLRFAAPDDAVIALEELLLRHAVGWDVSGYRREATAAGVMMIPIPRAGIFNGISGLEVSRAVPGIEEIIITVKIGEPIRPLPEGGSYLGFIIARAGTPEEVTRALRTAHQQLSLQLAPLIPVV